MISLLSYNPGFSGDFLSNLIHAGNNEYYQASLHSDEHNRYTPTYLYDMQSLKTHSAEWDFNSDTKDEILSAHNNKSLCITSHKYSRINETSDLVFDQYVRLFCTDEEYIRIGYAMWFYKSHIGANQPWPSRLKEIDMFPEPHKRSLYDSFHNWKFMAIKNGIELDLRTYIEKSWNTTYYRAATTILPGYHLLDLKSTIYEPDKNEIRKINKILNTNIDIHRIEEYSEKNRQIYKDMQIDDNNFFDSLHEYASQHIKEKPIILA